MTAEELPSCAGKVALVTGANNGVGYWTALHLARSGSHVVLACRSSDRALAARADLLTAVPDGAFEILRLDLADLGSVAAAAAEIRSRHDRLDLLVNNAGIALAPFGLTADGFESHLGANFLGHFALTGQLLDLLLGTPASRVVHVGSLAHHAGRIDFDDLQFARRRYRGATAYAQSKLANVMFMLELGRRLGRTGATTTSLGAHPGSAATGIMEERWVGRIPGIRAISAVLEGRVTNLPELSAFPSLVAATCDGLESGAYLGPTGFREMRGPVGPARIADRARDEVAAARLWNVAEQLTGISYLAGPTVR